MKIKSLFAIVMASMLLALTSCEDPSVKDMQDRNNELEGRLATIESGSGAQNNSSDSNPSDSNPSDSNPSGSNPSGNQASTMVSGSVGGHDYVDLGLPSGTLWATCDVGADSPEEYGDYFAWGETQPKSTYNWSTYKYGTDYDKLTKYCNVSSYGLNGYTDTKTVLEASDDAATANWGSGWRMPTRTEIQELHNNCHSFLTAHGGKYGCLFKGPNGNTLFLPFAGYYYESRLDGAGSYGRYWTSSLYTDYPSYAYFSFNLQGGDWSYSSRHYGLSVRPVVK